MQTFISDNIYRMMLWISYAVKKKTNWGQREVFFFRSGSNNSSDTYGLKYCFVEAKLSKNVLHVETFKWIDFIQIKMYPIDITESM